jgi:hypothetical protein
MAAVLTRKEFGTRSVNTLLVCAGACSWHTKAAVWLQIAAAWLHTIVCSILLLLCSGQLTCRQHLKEYMAM